MEFVFKRSIKNYIDYIMESYYFGKNVDETWYYKYGRSPLLSQV